MALKPVEILITGNTARLASDMGKAQSIVSGAFRTMASSLSGILSVGALTALGRSALQMGDDIAKATEKLGIGAEKLSAMKYAAELSDVSFEALQKGMKKFSQAITEAQAAGSDAATAFSAMGIATKDAAGNTKPLDTLFSEVADKFARMEDGAGKVSIAVALFGRAGMDMIPVLNKGSAGIAQLEAEAKRLGATISDETAKKLESFNDKMKSAGMIAKGTAASIMVDLVGAIEGLWKKIEQHGPKLEAFFAKIFGGQVSGFTDAAKTFKAPTAPSEKKTAAPNLDAIKKAAEEQKKLAEEYQKRQMKILGDRADALASFYGDETELAKLAAEEDIKGFEDRQKAEEAGLARTMALLGERTDALQSFYGDETELSKMASEEEINAFEEREKLRAEIAQPYADLYKQAWLDANLGIADSMASLYSGMQNWISSSLQGLIEGTMKVADVMKNLGKMMLSIITEYVAKWLVSRLFMAAMGKTFQAAEIAAATVTGGAVALAWAPAAAMVEIATLGAASIAAAAGLTETVGLATALAVPKLAEGGVVSGPTIALLGEKGPEMVTPLDEVGGQPIILQLDGEVLATWINKNAKRTGMLRLVPA